MNNTCSAFLQQERFYRLARFVQCCRFFLQVMDFIVIYGLNTLNGQGLGNGGLIECAHRAVLPGLPVVSILLTSISLSVTPVNDWSVRTNNWIDSSLAIRHNFQR